MKAELCKFREGSTVLRAAATILLVVLFMMSFLRVSRSSDREINRASSMALEDSRTREN